MTLHRALDIALQCSYFVRHNWPLLGGAGCASLLGRNVVRLLYLDEGGIDAKAPVLAVSGVLIHGDLQWSEVDRQIRALIEKFIPKADRVGFIFHATDIFHGGKYFDRRKPEWNSPGKRIPILNDLSKIIGDLNIPCVIGTYQKESFGAGVLPRVAPKLKGKMIHGAAIADCLIRADRWLAKFAPAEVATVVHEDGIDGKPLIKQLIRVLRSNELMDAEGFPLDVREAYGLPLKRIIDTVHFADKADARPLQLADLCAFIWARGLKQLPVPTYALEVLWRHMHWMFTHLSPPERAALKSSSTEQFS
jgi:hypothetical protein